MAASFPSGSHSLFPQTVIALVWDFDKTLIPGYMQSPLFRRFDIDEAEFWTENTGEIESYKAGGLAISDASYYLNHILRYVETGRMPKLDNRLLRELGREIEFYPGIPEFLKELQDVVSMDDDFRRHEIRVEHYIVSTGLRQMILGSAISPYADGIWGCEFIERPVAAGAAPLKVVRPKGSGHKLAAALELPLDHVIAQIGYAIDNTTKTRAIFEINKGSNKLPIDVNATIAHDQRRVPFQNMIYVADGPSDIPVFSVLNQYGGRTYAVYRPGSQEEFDQVSDLQEQGRVMSFAPADYGSSGAAHLMIRRGVLKIAQRIVSDRERLLRSTVSSPPRHILEEVASAPSSPSDGGNDQVATAI